MHLCNAKNTKNPETTGCLNNLYTNESYYGNSEKRRNIQFNLIPCIQFILCQDIKYIPGRYMYVYLFVLSTYKIPK